MVWFEAHNLILRTNDGRKLSKPLKFSVSPGEVIHVQGANGSGKTTLIKSLMGLHHKFSGKLIRNLPDGKIAYLPQLSNYEFFLPANFFDLLSGVDSNYKKKLSAYFSPTENWLNLTWNKASGGERQKLLILKTLLLHRPLLILDEPFNHLDKTGRNQINDWINTFLEEPGNTLILIHHGEFTMQNREIKTVHLEEDPNV